MLKRRDWFVCGIVTGFAAALLMLPGCGSGVAKVKRPTTSRPSA